VARIFWEGLAQRASLSEKDRRRFDPLLNLQIKGNGQQYQFHRDGLDPPEVSARVEGGLRWMAARPGFQVRGSSLRPPSPPKVCLSEEYLAVVL